MPWADPERRKHSDVVAYTKRPERVGEVTREQLSRDTARDKEREREIHTDKT